MIELGRVESSRILFLLFYAVVRNLEVIILIPLLFSLKKNLGSCGYSWDLYDADVTEFCLGASCLT